jgi:hypothetical protein
MRPRMCPSCGDALYPNGLAQVMSSLDLWHCYAKDCGACVTFKRTKIVNILHLPSYLTLDEELEQMAEGILRYEQGT